MDVGAASAFGCDGLRACAGVDVCPQPGSVAALTNTEGALGISGDASWEGRGHVLEPPGPGVVEAEGAVTSLGSVQPKTDPRGERPVRWLGQGPHFTPPMERQTAEDSDGVTLTCVARRACRACLERALRKDSASSSRTGVRYDLQGEQPDQA